MIRRVMVQQDEAIELAGHGELGVISEAALVREFAVWAQIVHRMGGHFRVTTHRQRNPNLEGEAFTVGCIVEWVDRTDDPREVPEQESPAPVAAAAPPPVAEPAPPAEEQLEPLPEPPHPSALMSDDADEERQAAAARAAYEQQQQEAGEDGIVYGADGEPEEDLTSIPASAR